MNKTKVYVVCISYDYGCGGAYSSKELAQQFIDKEHKKETRQAIRSNLDVAVYLTKYYIAERILDQDVE